MWTKQDTPRQIRGVFCPARRTPLEPARPGAHDSPVSDNDRAVGRLSAFPSSRARIDPERLARHTRAQVATAPPLSASRVDRLRRAFLPRGRVSPADMGR